MAIYQASKELTKFVISGLVAVAVDATVYFTVSQYLDHNTSKAISFCSGMLITYNMNKFWTWRQPDKNNKRLGLFALLYGLALLVNVGANNAMLNALPDYLFRFNIESDVGAVVKSLAVGIDKLFAFVMATGASATLTFIGQKYWLFKDKG